MNKKIIIGVVVILVILGIILISNSKKTDKMTTTNTDDNMTSSQASDSANTATTGLVIEDLKEGTGAAVQAGDTVVMNYTGSLQDGTKFDSSYDRNQPFETKIGVGAVIEGWDKGVPGMKVGGKRRLIIPSDMGYGSQGVGSIPPNSVLVFEVELLEIK